jgi:SpoVK/Ycf46/Vps4 family AAA+-type ATPase
VRGAPYGDGPPVPRSGTADDLVFPAALRQRIESDILRFFDDDVAALYRSLRVPHRRGVLLHGPPGNGKTSLIRLIGDRLPHVPCMLLRPAANFDTDDLEEVIRRWRQQAPAVLVIEDLDWLLEHTNVSTFLNLIDGVESDCGRAAGGLLLIATTNHPDKLDPAVNNRPGRFDVVVEIPSPDESLRAEFFRRELGGFEPRVVSKLASSTDGLSFAHLQEVLRLSGLAAIHAGRSTRTAEDLYAAARTARAAHQDAMKGFPIRPDMPFGLGHLVRGEG